MREAGFAQALAGWRQRLRSAGLLQQFPAGKADVSSIMARGTQIAGLSFFDTLTVLPNCAPRWLPAHFLYLTHQTNKTLGVATRFYGLPPGMSLDIVRASAR